MMEFVTLVALGVLVVGLGVWVAAWLLTAVGWLVFRGVRRGLLARETGDRRHHSPTSNARIIRPRRRPAG
ncbi:hypothetical protein [Blastococcus sp. KM273129]|uniref:hypothetical protein n=1 Tax=Blastococcus sp. KM273129 TaxID=2570315 RepID=UPI001F2B176E|nr:hypothetical protein [Blastococcus sp. KM273129]MCF6737008.1 hypothetical protein [Blastococcus sp. KM273129]